MCDSLSPLGRGLIPAHRLRIILRCGASRVVQKVKAELRKYMLLLGRQPVPVDRFCIVLWYAFASGVPVPESVLRERLSLLGRQPVPADGFSIVLRHALASGEPGVYNTLDAAHRAGTVPNATMGALMVFWSGPDADHGKKTTVIWVPGATGVSTGLPTEPRADSAWLMCPGLPRAHIMVGSLAYGLPENLWRRCSGTAAR